MHLLFGGNDSTRYALDRSTYEVPQILSISLNGKTHLKDLFDKTKFQNDKERFRPNGPSLLNF